MASFRILTHRMLIAMQDTCKVYE